MTIHLTRRELDVMAVLWDRGASTVAEVRERLGESLAYTTVLSILQGLEAKGHVGHRREGRAYRYHPRIDPTQVEERSLRRVLEKVFRGSRELLLTRLVSDEDVSTQELRRMRRMIDRRLREKREEET